MQIRVQMLHRACQKPWVRCLEEFKNQRERSLQVRSLLDLDGQTFCKWCKCASNTKDWIYLFVYLYISLRIDKQLYSFTLRNETLDINDSDNDAVKIYGKMFNVGIYIST